MIIVYIKPYISWGEFRYGWEK